VFESRLANLTICFLSAFLLFFKCVDLFIYLKDLLEQQAATSLCSQSDSSLPT